MLGSLHILKNITEKTPSQDPNISSDNKNNTLPLFQPEPYVQESMISNGEPFSGLISKENLFAITAVIA